MPLELLGGISPEVFARRYWQKKPLLIRQAIKHFKPILNRAALFALAEQDEVESRLIVRDAKSQPQWRMRPGPIRRRQLPGLKDPAWTLLVQGVDLHVDAVHELLGQFRFMPDARLDDLMISYASPGGGVGPHFDSYDVFLLQAQGRRRWRIGRQKDLRLQPDVPLKILQTFTPEHEYVLEPGDMLYLPPRYAHDGVALEECMTYSIGFRSPSQEESAQGILSSLAAHLPESVQQRFYADPTQPATMSPAAVPGALQAFAVRSVRDALKNDLAIHRAMGEYLTEPKAGVWFDAPEDMALGATGAGVALDRRTRMLYDKGHVYMNGESFKAAGKDFGLMRRLANMRQLSGNERRHLSESAAATLNEWVRAGWVRETASENIQTSRLALGAR